jgi:O-antigen ligase
MKHGELSFRRGYGIHNIYLFSLEQGGIAAMVLFLSFVVVCLKQLRRMTELPASEDQAFALGMWVFFLGLLLLGWAGQVFWRGFGTENLNCYILVLLVLATKRTNSYS